MSTTRISRRLVDARGNTVIAATEGVARWAAPASRIEPSAEEHEAVKLAAVALGEGRLDDLRSLLAPFSAAPTLPATPIGLARAFIAEGDFDAAEKELKRAEEHFPNHPEVWDTLAVLLRFQRRYLDELEYRRKLVLLVPRPEPGAYLAFAQACAKAHRNNLATPLGELMFVSKKLAERPVADAAARRERLDFAQQLYEIKPLRTSAWDHYLTASPCPPDARDVSVAWLPMLQWAEHSACVCRRLPELGRPGQRPTLAELRRVAVMPGFQWVPLLDEEKVAIDGFLIHRVKLQAEEERSPILLNSPGRRAEIRLPRELPLVAEPALLLGGMAQYYHQTIEYLSALAVAEALEAPANLRLVVNEDLAPFQLEQFALLGIDKSRLLRVSADQPVRFERLWTPSRLVHGGRWIDPMVPRWLRERFGAVSSAPSHRKLYLSRAGTSRRRVANDEVITTLLTARGYEVVHPESLSVAQQVALFAQASHIVGPTGAAFTNMAYAPPGTRVLVFYNRFSVAGRADLYFDALAQACGHKFEQMECKPVALSAVTRSADADIQVDPGALGAALDKLGAM